MILEKVITAIVKGTGGMVEKCRLFCTQGLAKLCESRTWVSSIPGNEPGKRVPPVEVQVHVEGVRGEEDAGQPLRDESMPEEEKRRVGSLWG